MNCILYARFSPRKNAAQCESCETQLDRLRSWASAMGYTITGEYRDDALSGKSLVGRDNLLKAMDQACREKAILAVYSLSRLARSTRDALMLTERLNDAGANLASLHELIDTSTPSGRFTFTLFAALAQLEREQTAERTSDAMQRHQAEGKIMGRKDRLLYGKRIESGALVDDDYEQDVIRRIRTLSLTGQNPRAICHTLDREGYHRRGGLWVGHHRLVYTILERR